MARYCYHMTGARGDVLLTAGASVALRRLVGLDAGQGHVVVGGHGVHPSSAQTTRATQITTAAATMA